MMKKIVLFLFLLSQSLMASESECLVYPPHYYQEMAGSYAQLAADYEQLSRDYWSSCGRFSVGADYLYWKADDHNLAYAISGINTTVPGRLYKLEPDWTSGYRIFGGYEFACSEWLFSIMWTHFNLNESANTTPSSGLTLFSTFGSNIATPSTITRAIPTWDLRFQSLLTDISYIYRARFGLSLIPELGIRWDKIRDNFDVTYISTVAPTTEFIRIHQSVKGVGPSVGLGSEWNFFGCLSLFGKFSWAFLWMDYNVSYIQNVVPVVAASSMNTASSFHTGVHTVDASLGVKLDYRVTPRFGVAFKVGWEGLNWFNFSGAWNYVDNAKDGALVLNQADLTMQGLFVRGEVCF